MTLRPPNADQARQLRELFLGADYSLAGIQRVFGSEVPPVPNAINLAPMMERTSESNLLNVLFRWFLLGQEVNAAEASTVLGPNNLDLLTVCGLLEQKGASLYPQLMFTPFRGLLIASDVYAKLHADDAPDYVLAIGPTADMLFNFVIRKDCDRALDLCSGCGVHGVSIAKHAQYVTTTDLNPQAAVFSSFNAALNDVTNMRCLSGDGFESVAGEKFDLIVSNPPFVMSPTKEFMYRDNPMDLDQFVRGLIVQAPNFLCPGGFFQMILEWVEIEGQKWQDRLTSWLADLPCDAMVLLANSESPDSYAKKRVEEMHQGKTGDYSEDVKQWTDYYRHFGVSRIHGGLVVLRRKDTPGWVRLERIAQDRGAIGDYVLATFAAEDFVRTHGSAESMLACRFRLTEGLRLIQKSTVSDNRWQPFETMAEFTGGWQAKTELDLIATNILAQFDGIGTVEELNDRFAKSVNAEPSSTIEQFCGLIRHLLRHGVLRVT